MTGVLGLWLLPRDESEGTRRSLDVFLLFIYDVQSLLGIDECMRCVLKEIA